MTREKYLKNVGKNIKKYRNTYCKLSQEKMAQKMGISLRYYVRLEQGVINISSWKVYELCQALGVKVADIYKGVDQE